MLTDWIMVGITVVYVIATICITRMTRKQINIQQEQINIYRNEEKARKLKQKIIVEIIRVSNTHEPTADGKKDLHVTANEVLESLIGNKHIKAGEYTLEDIFTFCLELHSQGELFLSPQDGEIPMETWKFSKRALK